MENCEDETFELVASYFGSSKAIKLAPYSRKRVFVPIQKIMRERIELNEEEKMSARKAKGKDLYSEDAIIIRKCIENSLSFKWTTSCGTRSGFIPVSKIIVDPIYHRLIFAEDVWYRLESCEGGVNLNVGTTLQHVEVTARIVPYRKQSYDENHSIMKQLSIEKDSIHTWFVPLPAKEIAVAAVNCMARNYWASFA